MDLGQLVQDYGYTAIAIGTFLEGEAILLSGGFAAHRGYLSLPIVIAIATVASFLGDQFYFFLGRRFGTQLAHRVPGLQLRLERMQGLIAKHQTLIILSIRFLYGLRIAGPIALGMNPAIRWPTYSALNGLGAVVWAIVIAGIGYLFGQTIELMLVDVYKYEVFIIGALMIGILGWHLIRWKSACDRP